MIWKDYASIRKALEDRFPDNGQKNDGHSIPDIYGKAIQLYIALLESKESSPDIHEEQEVRLWRGLLCLLALNQYLKLDLEWEQVLLPGTEDNLLDRALKKYPLKSTPRDTLFPEQPEWRWNGTTFYVLRKKNGPDLLLYSPITLLYPVADWKDIYAGIPEIHWFDSDSRTFLKAEEALNCTEMMIVAFWLRSLIKDSFSGENLNDLQVAIKEHLNAFLTTLRDAIQSRHFRRTGRMDKLTEKREEGLKTILQQNLPGVPEILTSSVCAVWRFSDGVEINAGEILSEQICYFQSDENPFENCEWKANYEIQNSVISGSLRRYAFFPFSPRMREYCHEYKLAEYISMTQVQHRSQTLIHVTLMPPENLVTDLVIERDYRVQEDESSISNGVAFPYRDAESLSNTVKREEWPLIAVWPGIFSNSWKYYYTMMAQNCVSGQLFIAAGETEEGSDPTRGNNAYVVRTKYAPYALPLKKYHYKTRQSVSVGMITPRLVSPPATGRKKARVAVDFGTTSVRVSAQIDNGSIQEFRIGQDDKSLIIMNSAKGSFHGILEEYFVRSTPLKDSAKDLYSIFRWFPPSRVSATFRRDSQIQPILDGIIMQFMGLYTTINIEQLQTDLKWHLNEDSEYYLAFMKELCLHITVWLRQQDVGTIQWLYALPMNLRDQNPKEVMESIWKALLEFLNNGDAGEIKHTVQKYDETLTESKAASRYFLSRGSTGALVEKGYMVVDIGGGSTDIALWQSTPPDGTPFKLNMIFHTSLNIAGREFFTRFFLRHIQDIAQTLLPQTNTSGTASPYRVAPLLNLFQSIASSGQTAQKALMDVAISNYEQELMELYQRSCLNGGWGAEMRREFRKAACLILFALGYQAGVLLRKNIFSIPTGDGTFVIAAGGRGANILNEKWLMLGSYDTVLTDMFRYGLSAAGYAPEIDVLLSISRDMKSEVVNGLLVTPRPENVPRNMLAVPIGAPDYKKALERFESELTKLYPECAPENAFSLNNLIADLQFRRNDEVVRFFLEVIYRKYLD